MNKDYNLFRDTVARFVDNEIKPYADEFEKKEEFPKELFDKVAKMGFFGIRYPEDIGGSNGNTTMFCIMCEELARGYLSLAAITAMQCLMGTDFIFRYGTKEHYEKYLIPAIKGEKIPGFALTEPDAGSDLSNIKTFAEKKGDRYIINGSKTWITNAPIADFFTVLCLTDREKKLKGANFFLVPRDAKGVSTSKKFDKLGVKSDEIGEVFFDNVEIPVENRLGEEGEGMKNLLKILAEIRVMTAALSLGLARAALEESLKYAQERVQFGKPIGKYQAIRMKIATMATEIEAGKHLLYSTTEKLDKNEKADKESMMAKYFLSEVACRCTDEATRIFGAYGFSHEYPAARFYADSRFLLYGGGTSEILQINIARQLGL